MNRYRISLSREKHGALAVPWRRVNLVVEAEDEDEAMTIAGQALDAGYGVGSCRVDDGTWLEPVK